MDTINYGFSAERVSVNPFERRSKCVEKFLLQKCSIFGKVEDVNSFLDSFKRLGASEKEQYVLRVWNEYGIESEQFYFVLQVFIIFVMLRHGLYWDEEAFQNAFLSVYEKLRFWDKEKGNLLSFIYSLVRDRVSQIKYWKAASEVRYEEAPQDCVLTVSEEAELCSCIVSDEVADRILMEEVSNRIMGGLRSEVLRSILEGEDSIYRRVVMWHMNREGLGEEASALVRNSGW
jgi:hypothetical protein